MNFKLLILSLILPLSLMAANTNQFDNVLIKNNFIFTGGTPGANKVLTSDASGNYTPQTPGAATGAFALTNVSNFFTTASTNTFNATTFTSNLFINGYLGINTNGLLNGAHQVIRPAPSQTLNFLDLYSLGNGNLALFEWGDLDSVNGPNGTLGTDGNAPSSTRLLVNSVGGGFYLQVNGETQFRATESNYAFGNNSSDSAVFSGSTWTISNSPSVNSGVWRWAGPGGTLTNGTSLTVLNTLTASNLVVNSTLNGKIPAQLLTNITSSSLTVTGQGTSTINLETVTSPLNITNITSSTLTITGQGTKVFNIEGAAGSGAAALTNVSNFFTLASTNTFNAATFTSNLTVRGDYVLGSTASSVGTLNGSTLTLPHSPSINSGVLIIATAGNTLSNNTSFTSVNTITASNFVAKTTDGVAYIDSGTNLLMRIIVSASAGTLQTEALYTMRTNSLSNGTLVNTIYTNNASRLSLNVGVALPTGVATVSAASIWTVSGSQTNYPGMITSYAGVAGAVTNFTSGMIQPNALYMITNINTGAGAPSVVNSLWNETRF